MIKNKAVVNEEHSHPDYWKNKYLELQRMNSMPLSDEKSFLIDPFLNDELAKQLTST